MPKNQTHALLAENLSNTIVHAKESILSSTIVRAAYNVTFK